MPRLGLLCLLLIGPFSGPANADDWTHWRGAARNGIVAEESGWNGREWPLSDGWKQNVGQGSTSPLVVGGRLYTFGWKNGQDTVVALDITNGKSAWSHSYPAPRHARNAVGDEGLYFGPTATPEYDAETKFLYTLGCDGELRCWNTQSDGEVIWRRNLYDDFQMPQRPGEGDRHRNRRDYGYTAAPFVQGDWLIVEVGAPSGTIRAFDKRTGESAWKSEYTNFAGHAGGLVPLTIGNLPCLAVSTQFDLVIVRVDGERPGETIATYPWRAAFANSILTPVADGNRVLLSSCYSRLKENQHLACLVQIDAGAAAPVWEQPYSSFIGSPVLKSNRLYIPGIKLYCLDWTTGELKWEGGTYNYGASLVYCRDERMIVLGNRGELQLIESDARSEGRYVALASRKILAGQDVWAHAVLSEGAIFARDVAGNLLCLRTTAAP